jgi:hypothetical protein
MVQAAIRPTVTQKVRRFLVTQGVEVRPWAGLDASYVELYRLMNRHRDDPAFWGPLAGLLRDVVEDVTDPESLRRLPSPQAELLSGWEIRSLVDDLRRALPGGDAPAEPTVVRRFGAGLSAHVLGGFLLLGLAAAGCNDDPGDELPDSGDAADVAEAADDATPPADAVDAEPDAGTCTPVGDPGWATGCALPGSSVLWCSIATSTMEQADRRELCGCFAGLSPSWSEGLTALFATESPEVVARALATMLDCVCGEPDLLGSPFPEPAPATPEQLCGGIPIYKGVAFD